MKSLNHHKIGPATKDGGNLVVFPKKKTLANLAAETNLIKRIRLVSAEMIVLALVHTLAFSERSCRALAFSIGLTCDITISRQAVWKFLRKPAIIPFLEKVIGFALAETLRQTPVLRLAANTASVLTGVGRILVGDATSICLHPSLADVYPGSKNQTDVVKSHLKLQFIADLITGNPVHFSLDPYGRSDMKAAFDFIPFLQAGDLLIRDLGYAAAGCLQAIQQRGAYFISRLKARDTVFDKNGKKINLVSYLQKMAPRPGMVVRTTIQLTKKRQFTCELIAIRVPEEVANQRRSRLKAKHKEQGWSVPSKEYLARQDWTLLLTNLPETVADNTKIKELYLLRWRIETIFKAAKSHSGLLRAAGHKTNGNHAKALVLAWVLMVIALASKEVFALGRLREVHCQQTGEVIYELEIHEASLCKMLEKSAQLLGFYMEMAACNGNMGEHIERTRRYNAIHNRSELTPGRIALSEVLASALNLEVGGANLAAAGTLS